MSEFRDFMHKEQWSQNTEPPEAVANPPNLFNMRIVTLQNLCNYYATERAPSRSLYNSLQKNKSYLASKPEDALDAVRAVFQKSLNKEIDVIVKKFHEKYLLPAIANVQANGYEVTEMDLHGVYCRIMEEAKRMYPVGGALTINENDTATTAGSSTLERGATPSSVATPASTTKIINRNIPAGLRKRKEAADSDTESDISQASVGFGRPVGKKAKAESNLATTKRAPPATQAAANTMKQAAEIPFEDAEKWNPDRLDENTVFVLGSKANSALGLSAQRGRIYIKHPGLFRYIGDHEDKMWLFENKQKTVKFGGKAFLVILDDIVQLAETPEYRSNPDVQVDDLNGFTLPQFIIDKIKSRMVPVYDNLRIKYGLNPSTTAGGSSTTIERAEIDDGNNVNSDLFLQATSASPMQPSDGGSDT